MGVTIRVSVALAHTPPMPKWTVAVRAHRKLHDARRRLSSGLPRFRSAMLSRVPGTSLGRIT